jgi:hypothetical protein
MSAMARTKNQQAHAAGVWPHDWNAVAVGLKITVAAKSSANVFSKLDLASAMQLSCQF